MEIFDININLNKEQFFNYIQNIPIGYMLINEEGTIKAVNHLLLGASYFTEQELIDQPYDKFIIYDETKEEFFEKLNSSIFEPYLTLAWKDVYGRTYYSKVTVWKSTSKPILYAIGFFEIKKENQLSLLSRFAESFVSENNIGLIIIDKYLHIIEISPLACKLLDVTKNQVLNNLIDDVLNCIPEDHRIVQRALIDGITVTNHAITWEIKQQKYDLLIDSNVIKDEKGSITGAYVVFKDVTNLRSLEQQVLQNDRLKTIGQIAAGTAHEIRNPLTSIKGFLQILKNNLADCRENQNYIDVMLAEIERINKLVTEILLLSKPKDAEYKPTDVNIVLKELAPIINNESILFGVEVIFELDKSIPLVMADSKLLKQMFLNIAKNGIEAMPDGGSLTITTRADDEHRSIEVFIHDDGPGIPNYIIDKVFEPFFTTKNEGTGLGLPICQKIIHDIGGQIRISSKGYGTTFQIYIPYI